MSKMRIMLPCLLIQREAQGKRATTFVREERGMCFDALSLLGWFGVVQRVHPHQEEAEGASRQAGRGGYEDG